MTEPTVYEIVATTIILIKESARVGPEEAGFSEFMISGKENMSANMPSVSVSLLPMLLGPGGKMKLAPRRKNIVSTGMIILQMA